jgi:hypothetical protein
MTSYLRDYLIAFLLTVVIEVAVALLLGYRKRLEIACVVLVNVFSHPLLNSVILVIIAAWSAPVGLPVIVLLEAGVVLVEWQLLCYALQQHSRFRLFILSLAMNSASYAAGVLLGA